MPNSKLIGIAVGFALTIAVFFYVRHIGYQACEVKHQAVEIKQAEAVNNVQHEVIHKRPLNSSELVNRLRQRAKAKREN